MQHVANFRIYYTFLLHDELLVDGRSITEHMFIDKIKWTILKNNVDLVLIKSYIIDRSTANL